MRIIVALALALMVGACATQSYSELPIGLPSVASTGTVAVAVHDVRPYIGVPPAIEMRDSLVKALKARGVSAVPVTIAATDLPSAAREKLLDAKARRSVLVTLRDWKTDTLMRTDFRFDITISVLDERGADLATNMLRGTDALGYSQAGGDAITRATAAKLDRLFADPLVVNALR
jgi:hypothetical protein